MNYWLDLFTVQTYEEFQKAGAKVSGFRERQWNRCQRIQPGDMLLTENGEPTEQPLGIVTVHDIPKMRRAIRE